ncbi:unnamed protein product [Polarella glacialis]|uniref:Uncharacterized protein n=1 Tax=Polarella glacialis TaxID=89957 RepID=A0A813KKB4_POLGL|nr:unnamed protein product [Polarella glacialis]
MLSGKGFGQVHLFVFELSSRFTRCSKLSDFPEHSTDVNVVIISDSEDEVQAPLAAYSEQPAGHSSHPISAAPVFTVPRHASQLSSSFSYTGRSAPAAPD